MLYISIGDMEMRNKMVAVTLVCVFLSGCAGMSRNETTGAAIGGVSGAVIGGANGGALGAGVGAAAGGLIGGAVGHSMDRN
jgi:outer membrane lipoprotein SlyB